MPAPDPRKDRQPDGRQDAAWRDAADFCDANGIEDVAAYVLSECGLSADGSCSMAGTEHCDWDCPMRP